MSSEDPFKNGNVFSSKFQMRLSELGMKRLNSQSPDQKDGETDTIRKLRELKLLIRETRKESEALVPLFWTEDEWKEIQYAMDFLEFRIQSMIRCTLENLEWYQNEGWKKFLDKGE